MASIRRAILLAALCLAGAALSACGPSMWWHEAMYLGMDEVKQCVEGRQCRSVNDGRGLGEVATDADFRAEVSRLLAYALRKPRLPSLEVIEYLLAQGADPNFKEGYAPLCCLYASSDDGGQSRSLSDEVVLPVLKAMHKAGADLSTCVNQAMFSSWPGVRAYLQASGVKPSGKGDKGGDVAVALAVKAGDAEALRWALSSGSCSKCEEDLAREFELRASERNWRLANFLCEFVPLRSGRAFHPMLQLVGMPDEEVLPCMRKLLERGADLNEVFPGNPDSQSLLSYAVVTHRAMHGTDGILRFLLDQGASPDGVSKGERADCPPLCAALKTDRLDVQAAELLLDRGADPNVLWNERRNSPLLAAVMFGTEELVAKLLARGANPLLEHAGGWTALEEALSRGAPRVVSLLSSKVTREALRDAEAKVRTRNAQVAAAQPALPLAAVPGEPAAAGPARRPRPLAPAIVAVFDVEARGLGLQKDYLESLSEVLAMRLVESGFFQVVPRDDLKKRLLDAKSNSYKACFDQSCQIELGRELAAEKSISVKVVKLGSKCTASLALFDLKRATGESAATIEGGCGEDAIPELLKQLVDKLTQ